MKSVLVMAGSLKRGYPDVDEDLTLIRALVDSNVPKFLADDLPLFAAIVKVGSRLLVCVLSRMRERHGLRARGFRSMAVLRLSLYLSPSLSCPLVGRPPLYLFCRRHHCPALAWRE